MSLKSRLAPVRNRGASLRLAARVGLDLAASLAASLAARLLGLLRTYSATAA